MGLHRGEVVRDRNGDMFGETVNVASRLEATAAPGRILASKEVIDELGSAPEFRLDPVGQLELRSISQPVFCYLCQ